jgi:hypothetical protein
VTGIATLDIADVGFPRALRTSLREGTPGLRHADAGLAAPLGAGRLPRPMVGRVGVIGFWDDEVAAAARPTASLGGLHAVLEPLRIHGSWPGVPEDLSRSRQAHHEGPAVVLTLARFRFPRAPAFFRTSLLAEQPLREAAGLRWATGLAKPPFVATASIWESTEAILDYAYGPEGSGHADAISANRARPFHHQSAFIRFRPLRLAGSLSGRNPLAPFSI